MRPIMLRMAAFGPFVSEQVVDFRVLHDSPLFLIHGPTGAGKSTILDAICYALYGVSSGKERDGKQMRSDFADPGTRSEVIFDFIVGERRFRVARRLPIEQKKASGSTTVAKAEAELWDRTGVPDTKDGELLATGVSHVTGRVEELLGLRDDQFRQVVVLPQGQFREFLTANSDKRAEIFSTLFETGHYKLIEEKLKETAKDLETEVRSLGLQQREILRSVAAASRPELDTLVNDTAVGIKDLDDSEPAARAAESAAAAGLGAGQRAAEKLAAWDKARERLSDLQLQVVEVDSSRRVLERGRRATSLLDLEAHYLQRDQERLAAEEALTKRTRELTALEERTKLLEADLAEADSRGPDRETARRERDLLEGLRARTADLTETRERLKEAEQRVEVATDRLKTAQESLACLNRQIEGKEQSLSAGKLTAAGAAGLTLKAKELERALDRRRKLEETRRKLAAADREFEAACQDLTDKQALLSAELEHEQELEHAWYHGQAAILAGQLAEGEPCPVCGSTDHPSPTTTDESLPTEGTLRRQREVTIETRDARDRAAGDRTDCEHSRKGLREQLRSLLSDLGEVADQTLENLDAQFAAAKAAMLAAQQAAERVPETELELGDLRERAELATTGRDQHNQALVSAKEERAARVAAVGAAESELPEDFRDASALEQAIAAAKETHESLEQELKDARLALNEHREQLAGAQSDAKQARATAATAADGAKAQYRQFVDRRAEAGFADDEDYQAAKRSADDLESLSQEIGEFDKNLAASEELAAHAQADAEGLQPPDIDALETAHEEAKTAFEHLIEARGQLKQKFDQLKTASKRLECAERELRVLEQEWTTTEFVAGVATGVGKYNQYRVPFERFVLAAVLDEVLLVASDRLRLMTKGRFDLRRVTETANRRRTTGLDLEVFDSYTGTARPVATLSGGEGFLAALALALGLSQIVQSHSGGIHLDTLFVDEGFGSLDPEVLDLALNTLLDLHRGRLVGIISHVPELKDRIDARLEIKTTRRGSIARFEV